MIIKLTEFERDVFVAVKKIYRGKVATYQGIAKTIGKPRAARAVGNALNKNPDAPKIPCHRVVKSDGNIGGYKGGVKEKIKLLRSEGVRVKNNKVVDFNNVLYKF